MEPTNYLTESSAVSKRGSAILSVTTDYSEVLRFIVPEVHRGTKDGSSGVPVDRRTDH